MTNTLLQKAATQFAEEWQGKGYEKGDTQKFWLELLQNVLGVQDVFNFIEFEDQVLVENTNFMDGYAVHPQRHSLPFRRADLQCAYGVDAGGVRTIEDALPLQQGYRL